MDGALEESTLDVMTDPGNRALVEATAERPMTAAELAEALDDPLSTVYRRLDRLVATPLLTANYRVSADGSHPRQYWCPVEAVHLEWSVADGEVRGSYDRSGGSLPSSRPLGAASSDD